MDSRRQVTGSRMYMPPERWCTYLQLFIVFSLLRPTFTGHCSKSASPFGQADLSAASINSPDINGTNTTLLFVNPMFTVPCCGLLSKWEVMMEGVGQAYLQVWRRVAGTSDTYRLLGENKVKKTTPGVGLVKRRVSRGSQIPVIEGDFVALEQVEPPTVRYITCTSPKSSLCEDGVYVSRTATLVEDGYSHVFSTSQSTSSSTSLLRGYAVAGFTKRKSSVECSDKSVHAKDTLAPGERLTKISTTHMDVYHTDSTFVIENMTASLPVVIDRQTGEITVSGTLTPDHPFSRYNITVRIEDVCNVWATCLIQVKISNVAKPILFLNLPATVMASGITERPIYTIKLSRQRDIDNVTCYVTSSNTSSVNEHDFQVLSNISTEHHVNIREGVDLNRKYPDVDSVALLLKCDSSKGLTNQSVLTVTIDHVDTRRDTERIFWLLLMLVSLLVLTAVVIIVMSGLVQRGIIKLWPTNQRHPTAYNGVKHVSSNDSTTTTIHRLWEPRTPPSGFTPINRPGLPSSSTPINRPGLLQNGHTRLFEMSDRSLRLNMSESGTVDHPKPWRP